MWSKLILPATNFLINYRYGSGANALMFGNNGNTTMTTDILDEEYLYQYGYPFASSKGIKKYQLITLENTTNNIPISSQNNFIKPPATKLVKRYQDKTFLGYKREDGGIGTRNYIVIIPKG